MGDLAARLCLITDRRLMGGLAGFADAIARALDGVEPGTAWVQVREKDLGGRALATLVRAALAVARPRGAAVIVNDRLDVALACGADGVHLPEDGLELAAARLACGGQLMLGCSRHAVEAALLAAHAGADLVQLGPIFPTPSKLVFGSPLGLPALAAARAALTSAALATRLVAVGGIDSPARAAEARAAGADAIAVIRAVWTAADPAAAARALAAA